ncbi:MAG: dihydropteroate synthase [Alphaproteobacteria bacterium]|nr:dihydropteroate synthase [Alphaproteobacteria bacterium]
MKPPLIMGILNVTPDSFSDGGKFYSVENAVAQGIQMMVDGANIIDIGGESTRPNSEIISPELEQQRVLPVITALKPEAQKRGIIISIDTRNASTMREAVKAGAELINDISALTHDTDSLKTAAATNAQIILMHMQGTPQTMQQNPKYENVVQDVFKYLEQRIADCVAAGIAKSRLIIDPGLGFGKTVEHNIALLSHAREFQKLGVPVLIGASRKSFLAKLSSIEIDESTRGSGTPLPLREGLGAGSAKTNEPLTKKNQLLSKLSKGFSILSRKGRGSPHNLLPASLAAAIMAASQGAQILRVHDVAETREALTVWQAFAHIDNNP